MKNPLKKRTLTDRVMDWADKRRFDWLLEKHGNINTCPWCRQVAQSKPGCKWMVCDPDPFLDILTCGVCGGTSLWRWEMIMLYVGPLDPPEPNHKSEIEYDLTKATEWTIVARSTEIARLKHDLDRLRSLLIKMNKDISQTLGQALGYPWFKDDQKNFPGSTEKDGVCVGEHVAESLASEAADKIKQLKGLK